MTEILEAIDAWSDTYLADFDRTLFGHCELMKKTAKDSVQYMPVTIDGRIQVALDDKKELMTWMRLTDPVNTNITEEDTWGIVEQKVFNIPIRLVFAHKSALGEDVVFDFAKELPEYFNISGYEYVFLNVNEVLTDHEAIYTEEFSDTVYERHRFTWNIYVVNITASFIKCIEGYEY